MTVLQVCAFAAPSPGNFIAALTHLEEQLAERGIRTIYAFADGAEGKPWCQEIQKRTKVYFLPTAKARILPKTYQIMKQIYRENDVDIVHTHFELYDMPATMMAPKKVKVFWHLHDPIKAYYQRGRNSRRLLMRLQYGTAGRRPRLLTVSQEHGAFAGQLGFPKEHITYFPNGINTARIQSTPDHKEGKSFLMFGWDVERKGVDLVVKAVDRMEEKDCRVVIVGQDACREYLEQQGKGNLFHPPVENINELYRDTRAFLHVSRAEGLSYALLEAIYAGIPVVCSDIPENRFAREFRNMFFVGNGDVDAIAREMDRLCRWDGQVDPVDTAYNRERMEEDYTLRAWCNKLIKLYLE